MADPKQSRGYANRNPGNIDWSAKNPWQGQIGIETRGIPPRFARFESHEYGIRALAMLLTTYFDKYNLRTVRGIINRWAPGNENDTGAYIRAVCQRITRPGGVVIISPDDEIDLHTYAHLRPLVEAIIRHELGGQPYSDLVLDEGLKMAGVPKPVATVAAAATTKTGVAAISVGAIGTAATAVAPVLQTLGGLPQWVGVAVVVAVLIGAVVWVLANRRDA